MREQSESERGVKRGGVAARLQLYGRPLVVVADPCLRFFHAEKDERFIVRSVVVFSQAFEMLVPRRAHLFTYEVFKSRFAAKNQPAVARPP